MKNSNAWMFDAHPAIQVSNINRDGTENSLPQLSKDLVTFLAWSAEPELEERKSLGIKVILFFIVIGILIFLSKRRLWKAI